MGHEGLTGLLREAVPHFHAAFGHQGMILCRVMQAGDGDELLRVTMELPASFQGDPDACLRAFDEAWWLEHCHRSEGLLVFDYERDGTWMPSA